MKSKREVAIWVVCPELASNPQNHYLEDHCYTCMPWWGNYPICPKETGIHKPLPKTGWCKQCRKYHIIEREK